MAEKDCDTRHSLLPVLQVTGTHSRADMQLKVDTGADSNIIPWSLFTAVCSEKDLKPTIAVLRAYNGSKIKMHGTCNLKLSHQAQSHTYTRDCEFFITEDGRTPLLSLQDSTKLGLIKVMCEVQQDLDAISDQEKERKKIEAERRTLNSSTASPATDRVAERYFMDIASKDSDMKASNAFRKKMLHDYSDTFTGTGTLEGVVKLELRDSFEGFRVPIRRVPIALQDPLRQELKELLEQGIIRRIKDEERVDCVNSFVIVRRSNGKIRLCLDPTRLNHSLIRPMYATLKLDDVMPQLKDAKFLTILDAKSGFWHLLLDAASSLLTTFAIAGEGRFCFIKLPFGLNCSGDYFQLKLDMLYRDMKLQTGIADDMIIMGYQDDGKDHDEAVVKCLKIARDANLRFGPDKCIFRCTQLPFFGQLCNRVGQHPDPEKVQAIKKFPTPVNKEQLHSFIGIATYLSKFVARIAEVLKPLRELTSHKTEFAWYPNHEDAFQKAKDLITNDCLLHYYAPYRRLYLEVDASKVGLGATLLQSTKSSTQEVNCPILKDGIPSQDTLRPVAYASKALTETEMRYANNERELLAVLHGLEKFKYYTCARKTEVITDHKSLEEISVKNIVDAPPRLQRLLLRTHQFDHTITYRKGKSMLLSDALSRDPSHTPEGATEISGMDIQVHDIEAVSGIPLNNLKHIRSYTASDMLLAEVARYVLHGWPESCEGLAIDLKPYFSLRNNIATYNGILMYGTRTIIPQNLKQCALKTLHKAHQGISKMSNLAREQMYWPCQDEDIKKFVAACAACSSTAASQRKEPLTPFETPHLPWEMLGADVMYIQTQKYLVVIDYHSRYPAVTELTKLSASALINAFERIFADTGLPKRIISDAGTNFISEEFQNWCAAVGVEHESTASYHHSSNGMVERAIQTLKRMWTRCTECNESPWAALLHIRNTPLEAGKPSPVQMLGLPVQRTLMPNALLNMKNPVETTMEYLNEKTAKMKLHHDRHHGVRALPPLQLHQKVEVQKEPGLREWALGRIIDFRSSLHNERTYIVQLERSGRTVCRNRINIRLASQHAEPRPDPKESRPPDRPVLRSTQEKAATPPRVPVTQKRPETPRLEPTAAREAPPPSKKTPPQSDAPPPVVSRYALRSHTQPATPSVTERRDAGTTRSGRSTTAPKVYTK